MTVKVHSGLCMKYSRWDIYNNYSTGGQGFMAVVNKPRPRATPSDSVCLLP